MKNLSKFFFAAAAGAALLSCAREAEEPIAIGDPVTFTVTVAVLPALLASFAK